MTGLTDRQVVEGFDDLFPAPLRAAHLALLAKARAEREDGWPTPEMVVRVARAHDVPYAPLGALFGLISFRCGRRVAWIDTLRDPRSLTGSGAGLSREMAVAYGWFTAFRSEVEAGSSGAGLH